MALSPERLRLLKFLSCVCWDEFYVPMDVPAQDCTYFAPAPLDGIRRAWRRTARLIREGAAPPDLALYVHWPFCVSRCTYCCCDMMVPGRPGLLKDYARMLAREMDAFKDDLKGLPFNLVWFGGGTPTFMPDAELDGLLAKVRESFTLARSAELYFEVSPATLTPAKWAVLRRHGVNHVTLGVQSMDDAVLAGVNRAGQTRATVERAYALIRGSGGVVVDFDLMLGLEGQSALSFVADLSRVMRMRPEVLHLYAFDPRPQTLFAQAGKEADPARRRDLPALMRLAARVARDHGYRSSMMYLDADASAGEEEIRRRRSRKFGGSVLGLGYSAMSHAWGSAWYQHLPLGSVPLETSGLPPFISYPSSAQEEMRGYVVRNLSLYGKVYLEAFREAFGCGLLETGALARGLLELEAAGALRLGSGEAVLPAAELLERVTLAKHLYSPGLIRSLLRRHAAAWRAFRSRGLTDGEWPEEAREKVLSRSLLMVCFRGDVPGTAPLSGQARRAGAPAAP